MNFFTGTAGVSPAASAKREPASEVDPCEVIAPDGAPCGRDARGPSKIAKAVTRARIILI
ncbi:MAG: hypothetical protein M3R52_03860 [Acidobacteriota bacterium]|nr:hypothetical protein [Acidobacteriota bacterium]